MSIMDLTQETARPARTSQRRLTFGLCINIVAIAFETIAVATAMPIAARELGGLSYYAWSFSLFLIGMLFSTVLAGRLSDRIGPAKPLLVGLAVFVAGLVIAGTAEHMLQLVGGRLVQGLGSGVINTAIFVCVAQAYSEAQRPKVFTYISTAWVLPAFVGPPAAAWLTETLSWHWVFYAVIPLVVTGGVLVWPSLRRLMVDFRATDADPAGRGPAPLWAAAVVALAAAALQLAGQRLDWLALGLLVAGAAGLVLALPRLMPGCFARFERGLASVVIVRGLLAGAFVGGEAFLPLMLVEEKRLALVLAGGVLTVASVGWVTGSWLQSRPWLTIRRDRLITWGCLSVAVGLGLVTVAAFVAALPYGVVAVAWIFSGFGMGLATSSTGLAVMSLSREAEQGRNGSSLNLSDALGSGLFVGVSGTLFAALHGTGNLPLTFGTLLLTMTVVAVLAALSSLRIGALASNAASRSAG
jgi:MFS family permease